MQIIRAPARRDDKTRFSKHMQHQREKADGTRRLFKMRIVAGAKSTKLLISAPWLGSRGIVAIAADALGVHCCIQQPHCDVVATIRRWGVRHEAEISLVAQGRSPRIVVNKG